MQIKIPEFAFITLVGASSSGKTTFAKKYFRPTEVLSSDFFRGMVCDDENNQSISDDAFDLLYYAAEKRLKNKKTVVLDATNLQPGARKNILELARKQDVPTVAIVFLLPETVLLERNKARQDRSLSERVIKRHVREAKQCVKLLKKEGFRYIYVLHSEEEADSVEITRTKLRNDKREEHGPFDIIGDIHGCYEELCSLLEKLGYEKPEYESYAHPEGRKVVFLGDFCDRGPKNVQTLKLVMEMVRSGNAIAVPGNHDVKLMRYLKGNAVQVKNGMENTVREFEAESREFWEEAVSFIENLVSYYVLDNEKLVIAHAGIKEEYIGRVSSRIRDFCLYGDVNGEKDEDGLPVRLDWAMDYRGRALIVYGHTPHSDAWQENNTWNIDTGCVFGGKLTAFRYPEKELVSVQAFEKYYEPPRPLEPEEEDFGEVLSCQEVTGRLVVNTHLLPMIAVGENHCAAALEVMSCFAADPRWLIYLPPTMSPCETSKEEGYLEYPAEAFAYYRKNGVKNVICEKKHMGSRAVIVLCHTEEAAQKRFGVSAGRGIIYTRTGRHFFPASESHVETELLDRLDDVLTKKGFWEDFHTEWVCLDTELLPWSEKAKVLLQEQYAPVGRAGRDGLANAVAVLEKAKKLAVSNPEQQNVTGGETLDLSQLLEVYKKKYTALEKYTEAYRAYCWTVRSTEDFRIAPFHLLAVEGRVFGGETNLWHMETLKKYCTGIDAVFMATEYIQVDTESEDSIRQGIEWWKQLTGSGGEGMVVKPEVFTAKNDAGLIQPAVKCRGREYLRIIYGPEYLEGNNLERLKKRSLSKKRALALKEFALGMEALQRFVEKAPLRKIHECVFGVLAFESEPVDPRL